MESIKERKVAGDGTLDQHWRSWLGMQSIAPIAIEQLIPKQKRAVILAPHPDDEILMAGGLLQQLQRQGNQCLLIAATDGEASHPGSEKWPSHRLQAERPDESRAALKTLGVSALTIHRLALPDSGVAANAALFYRQLTSLLRPEDTLVTTWALDGHPDHDACGRTAVSVAATLGIAVIEVPVWTWHWAIPGDPRVPWTRARRLELSVDEVRRKQASMLAFKSQLGPDSQTGREAVVPSSMLDRLSRPYEIFFT